MNPDPVTRAAQQIGAQRLLFERCWFYRSIVFIIGSFILILSHTSCKTSGSRHSETGGFFVEVKGEVKNPGTYHFQVGDTVQIAIQRAGGLYQWPAGTGILEPHSVTFTFRNGATVKVDRKDWGRYRLKAGGNLCINKNIF